ncbi:MAG: NAD(P)/FAD-dependent oxidoreductase [Sphingobacteriales bacterium]|nr:MAG: NAD(P)/FAD-dependent oxidoreductase [Sphingobacteriales bacterium]
MDKNHFEVIIIGGSYAGLSAAMSLGRSRRQVLIVDNGQPCNSQTPHSHNFLTQDGQAPANIIAKSKVELQQYTTLHFIKDKASSGFRTENGFGITTESGENFYGKKLLFATGVKDEMPAIPGFAECWGISVLHCPYCHGFEVSNQPMAVIANGNIGFDFCKLISNWTSQLTLICNGKSTLTSEQSAILVANKINIIEKEIHLIEHTQGYLNNLVFTDKTRLPLTAVFARIPFKQHCNIPIELGCLINEAGYIVADEFSRTNIAGIYAAGDNSTMLRSVASAVAAGNKAGAVINKELIDERF